MGTMAKVRVAARRHGRQELERNVREHPAGKRRHIGGHVRLVRVK